MCNNVGENFYAMQYDCFQRFFSKDPLPEFSFQRIIDSYKSIKLDETHFLNIIGWELCEPKETPEYCIKRNRTFGSELWLYFSFSGPMSGGKEILFNRLMAHIPTPTEDGEFIISSGRSHANRYSMTMQLVLSPGIYCTKKQTENSLKITCRLIPAIGETLTFRFREKTAEDDDEEAQSVSYQIGYLEDDQNLTLDDFRQSLAPHLQRYDMSRLGKRQMTATLKGLTDAIDTDDTKLSIRELEVILDLFQRQALPETDDRSLRNRKVKLIGDFLFEVLDMAFHRLQTQVIEKWQLERPRKEEILHREDVAFLISSSAMKQSIDSFFKGCELFQLLDDPNPIAQISQKRRLTFRGPGGLPDNALLLDKRDVHPSDFGRVCPVESPQGADLGLNLYLAQDARINEAGLIEARLIDNSSGQETFIDPYDEEELKIFICAQQHNAFGTDQSFVKTAHEELRAVDKQEVTHHCPSPGSFLGYAASLIPFFQHNDANRALMGANMMKQALPLADLEPPLVKTGYEATIAQQLKGDNPFIADDQLCLGKNLLVGYLPWDLLTYEDAVVISRRMVDENTLTHKELEEIFVDELKDPNRWEIIAAENEYLFDENGNIITQAEALDEYGVIKKGTRIENGTVLVSKLRPKGKGESLFFEKSEFNNRDKQERLFKKVNEDLAGLRNIPDVTSPLKKRFKKGIKDIHVLNQLLVIPDLLDLYNVIIAEKKTVFSEIVSQLIDQTATCRKQTFSRLTAAQQRMIIRLNRYLLEALYPKDAPLLARKKSDQSDRDFITLLMSSLFEDDLQGMKDESVYAPRDMKGIVQDVEWITDCLPQFVIRRVRILIETEHSVQVGDKLTGRHGNKGVVSRILPEKEMPYFKSAHRPCIDSDCVVKETHTHLDVIINPLTITSRMNLGQLYETTLGWMAAHDKEHPYVAAPFANDWTWSNIAARLKEKKLSDRQPLYYFQEGKETAICFSDGIHKPVTVGYQYFLKLKHLSEHKLRARDEAALNPSLKQPTVPALRDNPSPAEMWGYRKARQKSAQRLGEMEVWALEGHSAWNILDELLFLKSDADSLRHILIQQTIGLQGQGKKAFKIIDNHKSLYSWKVEATGSGITVTCTKGESEKELEKFAHDLGLKISPSGDNQYRLTYAPFDVYEREHQAFKTFVWYCRALGLEVEGINQDNRHIKLVGDAPLKWPKLSGIAMRIASDKERTTWVDNSGSREGLVSEGGLGDHGLWSDILGDPFSRGIGSGKTHDDAGKKAAIIKLAVPIDNPLFRPYLEALLDGEWFFFPSIHDGEFAENKLIAAFQKAVESLTSERKHAWEKYWEETANNHSRLQSVDDLIDWIDAVVNPQNGEHNVSRADIYRVVSENFKKDWQLTFLKKGAIKKQKIAFLSIYDLSPDDLYKHFQCMELDKLKSRIEGSPVQEGKTKKKLELVLMLIRNGIKPTDLFLKHILVPPKNLRWERHGRRLSVRHPLYENDLNIHYRNIIRQNERIKEIKLTLKRGTPYPIIVDMEERLRRSVYALMVNDQIPNILAKPLSNDSRTRESILSRLAGYTSGKDSLFRKYLLGKRVDFSGRGVIVPDPELGLDEVGLPFLMGKTLFRDLLIGKIIRWHKDLGDTPTDELGQEDPAPGILPTQEGIRQARVYLTDGRNDDQIASWLDELAKEYCVLLNRAPSLHRLSILAFYPRFHREDRVIRLNPYICAPFNADFDGDTMAVHAPVLPHAQEEAKKMLPSRILRSPGDGQLVMDHKKELALAYHLLTGKKAGDLSDEFEDALKSGGQSFVNHVNKLTTQFRKTLQQCGFTLGVSDFIIDPEVTSGIAEAWEDFHRNGFPTKTDEIQFWLDETRTIEQSIISLDIWKCSPLNLISKIGAGRVDINQFSGMRGIMLRPGGSYVPYPVLSNIVNGMPPLDYFVSCHGSRHGLSDKGLMTGPAGDLTNILIQASQGQYIVQEDCGTNEGIWFNAFADPEGGGISLQNRVTGRCLADNIDLPCETITGGTLITTEMAERIAQNGIVWVKLRTPVTCCAKSPEGYLGICQKCYGIDLATGDLPPVGYPAGIIAAQSIGEPGTQLTLRTFHMGGIAGQGISQGLRAARKVFSTGTIQEPIKSLLTGEATVIRSNNGLAWLRIEGLDEWEKLKQQWLPIMELNPVSGWSDDMEKLLDKHGSNNFVEQHNKDGSISYALKGVDSQVRIVKEGETFPVQRGQRVFFSKNYQEAQAVKIKKLFKRFTNQEKHLDVHNHQLVVQGMVEYLLHALQKIYNANSRVADHHFEVIMRTMIFPLDGKWSLQTVLQSALEGTGFLSRLSFRHMAENLAKASLAKEIDQLIGLKEKLIVGQIRYHK